MEQRSKLRRRAIGAAVLLSVVAATAWALRPRRVRIECAVVSRGPLRVTVDGDGKTRVRDRYVVSAPIAGLLERISLRAGDRVEAGEVVAFIVPGEPPLLDARAHDEATSAVAAARAAFSRSIAAGQAAEVALESARIERDRQRLLAERGVNSKAEIDRAELDFKARTRDLDAAKFASDTARYEIDRARAALRRDGASLGERVEVRAPIAGSVLRVQRESAGPIAEATALLEIGQVASLEIVVDLVTQDAVKIPPGAAATMEQYAGATPFQGRVRLVEPSGFTKVSALGVEEQRVNVVIDPDGDAPALGDGFRVEVKTAIWEDSAALRVPLSALFRRGDAFAVFIVDGGRARRREVRIGHRGELFAEVLSGLAEGQRVVVHPGDDVTDGARVRQVSGAR